MNDLITLEERIGAPSKTFVIAEAGVNHNGHMDLAYALIDAAAQAGADAIKFQTFQAEKLASPDAAQAAYQEKNIGTKESQLAMLKRLELSFDAHYELKVHCIKKDIMFLTTPFHREALDFLINDLNQDTVKFSSGDLSNMPLLHAAACTGRNIILSTGMATMDEIQTALDAVAFGYIEKRNPSSSNEIKDYRLRDDARAVLEKRVCVFHCTTAYPTPLDMVNLNAMETLASEFGCIKGYSDHTQGGDVSIIAAAQGARLIEKHFTLSRHLPGPDHVASLEVHELAEMIKRIRMVERVRGNGRLLSINEIDGFVNPDTDIQMILGDHEKKPHANEAEVTKIARKSLHTSRAVKAGEIFGPENLTTDMRPQTGLAPIAYWDVIGQVAANDIDSFQPVTKTHIQ